MQAITPSTRVLALTWVHSSTGLKLPLRAITQAVGELNAGRDEGARVLVCVDGVHGFGIEDVVLADLGCDFFMAGCHKWLFGPRGTGIVAGTQRAWASLLPTIPSFIDSGNWRAWSSGIDPEGPTTASRMSPGGYKAFEHLWALPKAFEFHQRIGKARVAERTHELGAQLKAGLRAIPGLPSIRRSPKTSRPASSPSTLRASRPAPRSIACVNDGSSHLSPPMRCRMSGSRRASRTPLPRSTPCCGKFALSSADSTIRAQYGDVGSGALPGIPSR